MKNAKIILIFLITISISAQAQQRGKNQKYSQAPRQEQIKPLEINAEYITEKIANLKQYDTDEVLKKLKVKSNEQKEQLSKALFKFNNKLNEIKIFNSPTIKEVQLYLNKKRDEAILSKNNFVMIEAKLQANEMLYSIKQKVQEQQSIINEVFEKELSEKQYKNWLNYKQKMNSLENANSNKRNTIQNSTKQKGKKKY